MSTVQLFFSGSRTVLCMERAKYSLFSKPTLSSCLSRKSQASCVFWKQQQISRNIPVSKDFLTKAASEGSALGAGGALCGMGPGHSRPRCPSGCCRQGPSGVWAACGDLLPGTPASAHTPPRAGGESPAAPRMLPCGSRARRSSDSGNPLLRNDLFRNF